MDENGYSMYVQPEQRGLRIMRIVNNCILAYVIPLTMILMVLPSDPLIYVNNLSMVLLVLAMELLQHKVKNFFLFSLGHMVCLYLLVLFASTWGEFWIRFVVGIIAMGINYAVRLRHTPALYPYWPTMILAAAIYFLAAYMHNRPLQYIGYGCEIAYTFLVLLFYNAKSLEFALDRSPSKTEVPVDKIRHTNRLIITIWVLLGTVLILLSTLLTFGPALLNLLWKGIRLVLEGIVLFFVWLISLLPQLQPSEETGPSMEDYLAMLGDQEPNPVLNLIAEILQIALVVLLVYVAIRFVWRMIHSMYGEFTADDVAEVEERVFQEPSDEEKKVDGAAEEARMSRFDRAPSAQIRRMYVRLIRRSPHLRDVRAYHTPQEIEAVSGAAGSGVADHGASIAVEAENHSSVREAGVQRAEAGHGQAYAEQVLPAKDTGDALDELHHLYEKARYAPETCSRMDVVRFRRALVRLRKN